MRALLDTSVLIGVERGRLASVEVESVAVAAMTIGELAIGAAAATDPDEYGIRRHTVLRACEAFDVRAFTTDVALVFGEVVGRMRRAGRRPSVPDAVIAATAIAEGMTLVTQDRGFLAFAEHGLDVVLV